MKDSARTANGHHGRPVTFEALLLLLLLLSAAIVTQLWQA